jgi:maleylpyruvate isomerase
VDTDELVDQVFRATERLATTVKDLPLDEISTPSSLPNWSRAHVLSHLARNADAHRNLLLGARSKQIVWMYASQAMRDADVHFGAMRPSEVVVEDVLASSRNFLVDLRTTPNDVLSGTAIFSRVSDAGPRIPVADVLQIRLSELEIHHVDLHWHYTFANTPSELIEMLIGRFHSVRTNLQMDPLSLVATDLGERWIAGGADGAPVVSGPGFALLGWLTGRANGSQLTIEPKGPFPDVDFDGFARVATEPAR